MKKFRCTVCGYVYEGDAAPEKCPLCKAPASKFVEVEEATADGPLVFADEHVIGVAKGCDDEMIKDLNNHFMGECTEVLCTFICFNVFAVEIKHINYIVHDSHFSTPP